jgi:hypothetical protein
MIRTSLPRATYQLLLRIHPAPFRDRFAEEMLWIFDEENQKGHGGRLLFDGAISVVRQHIQERDTREIAPAVFSAGIAIPAISPRRILQGGILASILTYGFFVLLTRHGTYKIPVAAPDLCSSHLSTPYHISSPPKPPLHIRRQ